MTFWEQAGRGRYKGTPRAPITEKDSRWSAALDRPPTPKPPESDPLYGPKDSYRYQAHLLYLAWQEGAITGAQFQKRLMKLAASRNKTFSFGGGC